MTNTTPTTRFAGKKFHITGTLNSGRKGEPENLIELQGGEVVKKPAKDIDYLIVGNTRTSPSGAEKKVAKWNEKSDTPIKVLSREDFKQLLIPETEMLLEMLHGSMIETWNLLFQYWWLPDDTPIMGQTFTNCDWTGADLTKVVFSNCKFQNVNLQNAEFNDVVECTFAGDFNDVGFHNVMQLDFRNCNLNGVSFFNAFECDFRNCQGEKLKTRFYECDFRGANINKLWVSEIRDCNLSGAVLPNFDCMYGSDNSNNNFNDCDLTGASMLGGGVFTGCSFNNAILTKADLSHGKFNECSFKNANLTGAALTETNLTDSDLRKANLQDAYLNNANVERVDFRGADTTGATIDGANTARAKNFKFVPLKAPGKVGPNIRELAKAFVKPRDWSTSVRAIIKGKRVQLTVDKYRKQATATMVDEADDRWCGVAKPLADALLEIAARASDASIELATVEVSLKPKKSHRLAVAAWCEAFGLPIPTAEEWQDMVDDLAKRDAAFTKTLVKELQGGKKGIAKWNARGKDFRIRVAKFAGANFAKADLRGACLTDADFRGADLSQAKLGTKEHMGTRSFKCFSSLDFSEANLSKALIVDYVSYCKFNGANLQGAKLAGVRFYESSLQNANLKGADFTSARFDNCDLRGVDFSGAKLSDNKFEDSKFDEATLFPAAFDFPKGLKWAGKGKNPHLARKVKSLQQKGPVTFEAFMQQIKDSFDKTRFKNATRMLKADRFQLYSQVAADSIVGVVKGQSDASLVYSCMLNSLGEFSCCTQNLKSCGGLRGSLCKHLLVLIIGLTKADQFDPTTAHLWVSASNMNKPKLNKAVASEVFLKYKGAEAGEIDWRPTETMPEDYYAF